MPALSISVDGKLVAEVPTAGLDVLSIRIGGTVKDDNLAEIDVSGGAYPDSRPSTYLIWTDLLPVLSKQLISVIFKSEGTMSHEGRTIQEPHPDELGGGTPSPKTFEDRVNELRAMPSVRNSFSIRAQISNGKSASFVTQPDEYAFSFLLLWNSQHPTRARLMLSTYDVDFLIKKAPSTSHLREYLAENESVELEVS
jgi:hypothetical protein